MTLDKLNKFKENNKKICGYAATAKSTTVLNYCNIGNNIIDYICDTTEEKIGKFSPGSHIPIVPVKRFHEDILDFSRSLAPLTDRKLLDDSPPSRVALVGKEIVPIPIPEATMYFPDDLGIAESVKHLKIVQ